MRSSNEACRSSSEELFSDGGCSPADVERRQVGRIEAAVVVPVGELAFGEQIGCALYSFEGEAEMLGDAAAGLVAGRVGETETAHTERSKRVAQHGIGRFCGEAPPLRGFANPIAGVAL